MLTIMRTVFLIISLLLLFSSCSNTTISDKIKDSTEKIYGRNLISENTSDGYKITLHYKTLDNEKFNGDHLKIKETIDKLTNSLPKTTLDNIANEESFSISNFISWETPNYTVLLIKTRQPRDEFPFKIEIISRDK